MNTEQSETALQISLLLLCVLAFLWASQYAYEDEIKAQEEACELHKIWLDGAYARVPEAERYGRPITAREYRAKCENNHKQYN